ncbi:MAG: STAS domain-containing protein [Acidimicrobiaceae bacterium]|nr:STAS domain-containing protein [Acidimicrobiaceae bacterium]
MNDATAGEVSDTLKIDVVVEAGRVVCRLSGELDSTTGPVLRAVLNEQLDASEDTVIDLSAVSFIDSSGVGVLVGALRRFQETGGKLSLRAPNASLRRVFEMTGLSEALPIE